MLTTRERIISAQTLADDVQTAVANAQKQPVIILNDAGEPVAYLIGVDQFDRLIAQLETKSPG